MTDDTCPVCGKGEIARMAQGWYGMPVDVPVSHLDCVRHMERALKDCGNYTGWTMFAAQRDRAEQAEAEVERLDTERDELKVALEKIAEGSWNFGNDEPGLTVMEYARRRVPDA